MQVSRDDLYRIILEEYLFAEGRTGDEAAEALLKRIMGDKYRPPEERDPTRYAKHYGDTEPMEKPTAPEEEEEDLTGVVDAGETYPIDPEGDETPFRARQSMSPDSLADAIGELIHGRDPEEVSKIFQLAFEKLPGVELSSPGDEDYPDEETLYAPGAEGRPIAGFQLEELMELIREMMEEGHYHDMGDEDEMYEIPDAGAEPLTLVQRIEKSYQDLQGAFDEIDDEVHKALARALISDLETLMDTMEHPEDFRE
jgi:hypothetical protein